MEDNSLQFINNVCEINRDNNVENLTISTQTSNGPVASFISTSAPASYQQSPYLNSPRESNFNPPNIFVKIPLQINQQFQNRNNDQGRGLIKDEPIKFETTDNSANQKSQPQDASKNQQIISIFPGKTNSKNRDLFQLLPSSGNLITAKRKECIKCHKCLLCPYITISEANFEKHKTEKHSDGEATPIQHISEQLQCPGCENRFYKEKVLRLHLLEDHEVTNSTETDIIILNLKDLTRRISVSMQVAVIEEDIHLKTTDTNKSRIYLKNVQSLQNPDLSQSSDCCSTNAENGNGQKSGKIFIKNVQLLRKPNLEQTNPGENNSFEGTTDFAGNNNLHESQYSFVVPFENDENEQLVAVNNQGQEPQLPTENQQLIFNDNTNILCQQNSKIHFVENSGYSLGNYTNSNQPIVFSNMVSSTTQSSQIYGPGSNCYSSANSIISPSCSTNVTCEQFPAKQNSKIFIKNIKVLKNPHLMTPPLPILPSNSSQLHFQIQHNTALPELQRSQQLSHGTQPAIHLKSVHELNLMTMDQVHVQNLLPLHHHHSLQYITTEQAENTVQTTYENIQNYQPTNENGSNTEPEDMDLEENIVVDDEPEAMQQLQQDQEPVDEDNDAQIYFENDSSNMYHQIDEEPLDEEVHEDCSENIVQNLMSEFGDHTIGDQGQSQFSSELSFPPKDVDDDPEYAELTTVSLEDDKKITNESVSDSLMVTTNFFNLEETDDDILFVCAEELINSNLQQDEQLRQMENKSESSVVFEDAQENVKDDDLMTRVEQSPPPPPTNVVFDLEAHCQQHTKGRIYVAKNLMEQSAFEKIHYQLELVNSFERPHVPIGVKNISISDKVPPKTSNRGRPKGAKYTGITKMKKTVRLFKPEDIGMKCPQPNCGIRFKTNELIEYHERCHSYLESVKSGIVCPECTLLEFRNWNTLHTHLWREHKRDMELYSCHMCNFKTPIFTRLTNIHMKIHSETRDFVCEQCNKAFKNSKQLKNHRRNHRLMQEASLSCPSCSLKFVNPDLLRAHIEKMHIRATVKEWVCGTCSVKFLTQSALRTHSKEHIEGKRYSCEDCDYTTNDHNAFRRHKMTHSRLPKYKCPYCNYTCIQSTTYRIHLQKRHENEANDLIYKCNECSFITISKVKYGLHFSKHKKSSCVSNRPKTLETNFNCVTTSSMATVSPSVEPITTTTTIDEQAVADLRRHLDVVVLE